MTTLRIEHPVPSFEGWKKAFDSDPMHREASGVRRYKILRPVDDPEFVTVDLEFEALGEAEAFRAGLEELWRRVEGTVMQSPRAQLLEPVESKEYVRRSSLGPCATIKGLPNMRVQREAGSAGLGP